MGDLIHAERIETELVFRGRREGLAIEHRSEVSPLALLNLVLVTRPAAGPLPPTSPAMAIDVLGPRR